MKVFLRAFLFLACISAYCYGKVVPSTVEYCGMTLHLTEPARRIIQKQVNEIQRSPRYFDKMVMRAEVYMPFIHEAFNDVGVPLDLSFISIQESGLKAHAVSKSNAVGFWQFKQVAAKEYGLKINEVMDERKHIYRASFAAADYLASANHNYKNWVYAVIAYYEGPTGSRSHTNPAYYGKKVMKVDQNLHWYAIRAISHKLAYEDALRKPDRTPLKLRPFVAQNESSVKNLYSSHGISEESFFRYNPWLKRVSRLPYGQRFTYYIPTSAKVQLVHIQDPSKAYPKLEISKPPQPYNKTLNTQVVPSTLLQKAENDEQLGDEDRPLSLKRAFPPAKKDVILAETYSTKEKYHFLFYDASQPQYPPAKPAKMLSPGSYVEFFLEADLHYGSAYIQFKGSDLPIKLAQRHQVDPLDFLSWNSLSPHQKPDTGSILYLTPLEQAEYHIVASGENLAGIAIRHGLTVDALKQRNRMSEQEVSVFIGEKIYLKKKKPKKEKKIILRSTNPIYSPKPTVVSSDNTSVYREQVTADSLKVMSADTLKVQIEEVEPVIAKQKVARWVRHVVKKGETLYDISKRYDTKVEVIKMSNKLETDSINSGQILRVFTNVKTE